MKNTPTDSISIEYNTDRDETGNELEKDNGNELEKSKSNLPFTAGNTKYSNTMVNNGFTYNEALYDDPLAGINSRVSKHQADPFIPLDVDANNVIFILTNNLTDKNLYDRAKKLMDDENDDIAGKYIWGYDSKDNAMLINISPDKECYAVYDYNNNNSNNILQKVKEKANQLLEREEEEEDVDNVTFKILGGDRIYYKGCFHHQHDKNFLNLTQQCANNNKKHKRRETHESISSMPDPSNMTINNNDEAELSASVDEEEFLFDPKELYSDAKILQEKAEQSGVKLDIQDKVKKHYSKGKSKFSCNGKTIENAFTIPCEIGGEKGTLIIDNKGNYYIAPPKLKEKLKSHPNAAKMIGELGERFLKSSNTVCFLNDENENMAIKQGFMHAVNANREKAPKVFIGGKLNDDDNTIRLTNVSKTDLGSSGHGRPVYGADDNETMFRQNSTSGYSQQKKATSNGVVVAKQYENEHDEYDADDEDEYSKYSEDIDSIQNKF